MIIARKDRRSTNGFTMIELLAVLGIIAILAGITFGLVSGVSERGRTARAQTELRLIAQALEQYRSHYGDYPWVQTGNNEIDLFNALAGTMGPQGDYFTEEFGRTFIDFSRWSILDDDGNPVPEQNLPRSGDSPSGEELRYRLVDPWGNDYQYYYKSQTVPDIWNRSGFILYSAGPSGEHQAPDPNGEIAPSSLNADNLHHDD